MEKNDERKDANTNRIWLFILPQMNQLLLMNVGLILTLATNHPEDQPSEEVHACMQTAFP
jgi:hypothetical protein